MAQLVLDSNLHAACPNIHILNEIEMNMYDIRPGNGLVSPLSVRPI